MMTTESSHVNKTDISPYPHRPPADVIAHLRTKQGKRVYISVLSEIRDMASGGDAGECGMGLSVREYYYPHFTDEDFCEILRGLGETVNA